MNHDRCQCTRLDHRHPPLIVLTGGPGGGKTAVLEIARRNLCEHIAVLPEAASIVFGGGFWRRETPAGRKAAQRAIFHVQREVERLVVEEEQSALLLCDRGTLDGLAYWPGAEDELWADLGTTRDAELRRYAAVIHLRSPAVGQGYNHRNPVRTETALEAAALDTKVEEAWRGHPARFLVESTGDFLDKARRAIDLIRDQLPPCCRTHPFDELATAANRAS